jgi:hypothetical protein
VEVVCKCESQKTSISGTLVQEHAKEVATKPRKSEFRAYNGWLESFRRRHHIVFNEIW